MNNSNHLVDKPQLFNRRTEDKKHQYRRCGDLLLDLRTQVVMQKNSPVNLTPKAFSLLVLFFHHPGKLVTKEQLFSHAWPKVVVTDAALTVVISELRKALNIDKDQPGYIQTVFKKGYRLLGHVEDISANQLDFTGYPVPSTHIFEHIDHCSKLAKGSEQQLLIIEGHQGIGKTHLIQQVIPKLRHNGWIAITVTCPQPAFVQQKHALLIALVLALFKQDPDIMSELIKLHAPTSANILLRTSASLKKIEDTPSAILCFFELTQIIESLGQIAPIVIQLEDAQHMDTATQSFILQLVTGMKNIALFVITNCRPIWKKNLAMLYQASMQQSQISVLKVPSLSVAATQTLQKKINFSTSDLIPLSLAIRDFCGGNPWLILQTLKIWNTDYQKCIIKDEASMILWFKTCVLPPEARYIIKQQFMTLSIFKKELLRAATCSVNGEDLAIKIADIQQIVHKPLDLLNAELHEITECCDIISKSQNTPHHYAFSGGIYLRVAKQLLAITSE